MDLELELTQVLREVAFGVESYTQDKTKTTITTIENKKLDIEITDKGYMILNEIFESLDSLLMAKSEMFALNFNQQVFTKLQRFIEEG